MRAVEQFDHLVSHVISQAPAMFASQSTPTPLSLLTHCLCLAHFDDEAPWETPIACTPRLYHRCACGQGRGKVDGLAPGPSQRHQQRLARNPKEAVVETGSVCHCPDRIGLGIILSSGRWKERLCRGCREDVWEEWEVDGGAAGRLGVDASYQGCCDAGLAAVDAKLFGHCRCSRTSITLADCIFWDVGLFDDRQLDCHVWSRVCGAFLFDGPQAAFPVLPIGCP